MATDDPTTAPDTPAPADPALPLAPVETAIVPQIPLDAEPPRATSIADDAAPGAPPESPPVDRTIVSAPPTPASLLGAIDPSQSASNRRPPVEQALEPTSALPALEADIDLTIDAEPPPVAAAPAATRRTPRREQTGETGMYADRLRRDAFEVDVDDIPDIPAAAQESGWQYITGRHPPTLRRFLLFRALPIGLLLAITAWSWLLIRSGDRAPPRPGDAAVDGLDPSPELAAVTPPVPVITTPEPEEDVETVAALKFLDSYAENVTANGTVGKLQLKQAISLRKVTLLNLWAPWCPPCLQELPFLKDLFTQSDWDGDVKFIPLMVLDPTTARVAHRDHAANMPPFDHFLIDRDLSSGPKAALLAAEKRIPTPLQLPVTILFDCRRQIHKVYTEAFDTLEEFKTLIHDVETLRSSAHCRPPARPDTSPVSIVRDAPPASAATPAPKRGCGDDFCDRKTETCECAQDCPCSPAEICRHRPGENAACVDRTSLGM